MMPEPTDLLVPVNEVFRSLQGEGTHVGTPAIFIRLQGCDVGCPWCDTKHTWTLKGEGDAWRTYEIGALEEEVRGLQELPGTTPAPLVVITGGEPLMHPIVVRELVCGLLEEGLADMVQIETSGTYPLPEALVPLLGDELWLTVSPKVGMPGGRRLDPSIMELASEVKQVIGSMADYQRFLREVEPLIWDRSLESCPIFLQPNAEGGLAAQALCRDLCIKNGRYYRLSLQTHKILDIR